MQLVVFGHSVIRIMFFDTDNYRLVRRSIEKPVYKEKLRMRSYRKAGQNDNVFLELKKKYQSVVYKRRNLLRQNEAFGLINNPSDIQTDSQIEKEIMYFCDYYQSLRPVVYLSYEREAYYATNGSDFRVTFDEQILSRTDRLSLDEEPGGQPILAKGMSIMEIKTAVDMPLWMTQCLSMQDL